MNAPLIAPLLVLIQYSDCLKCSRLRSLSMKYDLFLNVGRRAGEQREDVSIQQVISRTMLFLLLMLTFEWIQSGTAAAAARQQQ